MSENINLPENAFDEGFDPANPGQAHNEAPTFIRHAMACFIPGLPIEQDFKQADWNLVFPGITDTRFEKGKGPVNTGEPLTMRFTRVKPGSKDKIYYIILREYNSNNEPYFNALKFKNFNGTLTRKRLNPDGTVVLKDNGKEAYETVYGEDKKPVYERNAFFDFQAEELAKLKASNPAAYAKFEATGKALFNGNQQAAWIPIRYTSAQTGYDKSFGEVREYLKDIVIFNSVEEWEKAKKETGQTSNGISYDHYPRVWGSDPARLQEFVKTANAAGKPHAVIAKEGLLEGEAINGQPVNIKALLAEILDIPENMVTL